MGKNVQRQAALDALITGATVKQAAEAAGISEKTVRRWLDEPAFAAEIAEARRTITNNIMAAVKSKAVQATDVLGEIMSNQKASPYARVQAAKTVLDTAFKAIETAEIIDRIEKLEAAADDERIY